MNPKVGSNSNGPHFWLATALCMTFVQYIFVSIRGSDGRLCHGYFCLFVVTHCCLLFKVLFLLDTDFGSFPDPSYLYLYFFLARIVLNVGFIVV